MDNNKTALRREMLALRSAVVSVKLNYERLSAYPEFKKAEVVFCYVSAKGEVDTIELLDILAKEKVVVVPYCLDKNGNMICVRINSTDELEDGFFGIPAPVNPVEFPKDKIDFAIVPGVAFDKEGHRLGYGKGYYDKFLSDISPFTLGICQGEFFKDSIPHDTHDIVMDEVLVL